MTKPNATALCSIRPAIADDVPFLFATWLPGFRHGSPWAHRITNEVFYKQHRPIVAGILQRPGAKVLVAYPPGDLTTICGYIAYEPGVIHWTYVKQLFRRLGIARALVAEAGFPHDLADVVITHPTRVWFTTQRDGPGLEEKFTKVVYNPYLAFP